MKRPLRIFLLSIAALTLAAAHAPAADLVVFEAESGTLGADLTTGVTDGATYLTTTTNGTGSNPGSSARVAAYSVTFPAAGTYDLYARVYVGPGTYDDDSMFIAATFGSPSPTSEADWHLINGLADVGYTTGSDTVAGVGTAGSQVWKWLNLTAYSATSGYTVSAGGLTRTFQIGAREDGLYIDSFAFGAAGSAFTVAELDAAGLVAVEAEHGMLGAEFDIDDVSGATCITITTDSAGSNPGSSARVATYAVAFPCEGTYDAYARVHVGAGSYSDDSMFIATTFGSQSPTNSADWHLINGLAGVGYTGGSDIVGGAGTAGSQVWKWINLTAFASTAGYTVNAGDLRQTFQIGAREDGLCIDRLAFGLAGLEFTVNQLDRVTPLGAFAVPVLTNGNFMVMYRGSSGREYAEEATTSLAPAVVWTALQTNTADASGLVAFTNTPSDVQAFYRVRDVTPPPPFAVPDGYATQNGGTTGGGNATPIQVSTASAFRSAVGNSAPAVIIVEGRINLSGDVTIGSNKTIKGADAGAGLYGGTVKIQGSNYIIQNLAFGPADGDVLEVSGAENVFITKCAFHDSTDELCSIVRQADYVTVSWSRFYFDDPDSHSYAHLIGNGDDVIEDRGKLHVTLHHNWYDAGVRGRMPRVRFGHVHIYNNYYSSPGNGYCIGVGFECHIRVENSHFDGVNNPWADYGGTENGEIGWESLKFTGGSSQPTFVDNSFPVFAPPYPYTMDDVDDVQSVVTAGAGNVH